MNVFVVVLAVLNAFAAIPTILCERFQVQIIGLECSNMTDSSVTLTPDSTTAAKGDVVTLTCNTTLPATFPQWLINEDLFTVTHLPVGFTASDFSLQFMFDGDVDIRCVFRLVSGGSIVNICSNIARVVTDGPRDELTTDPCNDVNIISFLNNVDGFIIDIVGLIGSEGTCEVSVSLTDCADSEHHIEQNTKAKNETGGAVTIGVHDATFYGDDVTVTVQSCLACNPLKYYLPKARPTEYRHIPRKYVGLVIDDISNNSTTGCFGKEINYEICIHSEGSNGCFPGRCGNGNVFMSSCNQSNYSERVGIEVNDTENDTIISIFCTLPSKNSCVGSYSEVMLLNIALLTCDENAEYKEGKCVCRENYTGDGIVCRKREAPPQPRELFFSMDCNVPVSDGRTGVISWMDGERDDEVVYPGAQKAVVKLSPPGNTVCSGVTDTRCTFNITTEDYYTVSLTLTNDAGSSEPVSLSFNTMVFQLIEDNLRENEPSVRVTVNEYCSNTNVTVSFGERENGSNNSCDLHDFQSATLAPDVAMTFYVNETIVILSDGYEYCFNISSFREPSSSPSPEPTSKTEGGLSGGDIAGIVIVTAGLAVVIVVVLIVGFIVYWNQQNRNVKLGEKTALNELSS